MQRLFENSFQNRQLWDSLAAETDHTRFLYACLYPNESGDALFIAEVDHFVLCSE